VSNAKTENRVDGRLGILDAAEASFSELGFAGTGMKLVATRASVAQGLIHYHFKNKEGLYEAVIERRATLVTRARLEQIHSKRNRFE
jgi:AcrR family transcriptional regulator